MPENKIVPMQSDAVLTQDKTQNEKNFDLYEAIRKDDFAAFNQAIEDGAQIDVSAVVGKKTTGEDLVKELPIYTAYLFGRENMIEVLEAKGIPVPVNMLSKVCPSAHLLQGMILQHGKIPLIEKLIQHGENLNVQGICEALPLSICIQSITKCGLQYHSTWNQTASFAAVEMWVNNMPTWSTEQAKQYASSVVYHGDLSLLKLLLDNGADPELYDTCRKSTPIETLGNHGCIFSNPCSFSARTMDVGRISNMITQGKLEFYRKNETDTIGIELTIDYNKTHVMLKQAVKAKIHGGALRTDVKKLEARAKRTSMFKEEITKDVSQLKTMNQAQIKVLMDNLNNTFAKYPLIRELCSTIKLNIKAPLVAAEGCKGGLKINVGLVTRAIAGLISNAGSFIPGINILGMLAGAAITSAVELNMKLKFNSYLEISKHEIGGSEILSSGLAALLTQAVVDKGLSHLLADKEDAQRLSEALAAMVLITFGNDKAFDPSDLSTPYYEQAFKHLEKSGALDECATIIENKSLTKKINTLLFASPSRKTTDSDTSSKAINSPTGSEKEYDLVEVKNSSPTSCCIIS